MLTRERLAKEVEYWEKCKKQFPKWAIENAKRMLDEARNRN